MRSRSHWSSQPHWSLRFRVWLGYKILPRGWPRKSVLHLGDGKFAEMEPMTPEVQAINDAVLARVLGSYAKTLGTGQAAET